MMKSFSVLTIVVSSLFLPVLADPINLEVLSIENLDGKRKITDNIQKGCLQEMNRRQVKFKPGQVNSFCSCLAEAYFNRYTFTELKTLSDLVSSSDAELTSQLVLLHQSPDRRMCRAQVFE